MENCKLPSATVVESLANIFRRPVHSSLRPAVYEKGLHMFPETGDRKIENQKTYL